MTTTQTDPTKEKIAVGAFLSAVHDQGLDGARVREAMLDVLGLSATLQARDGVEPVKPMVDPIYYMLDNHTFKKLSEHVPTAIAEIETAFNEGYTSGMLCSKRAGFKQIHATGDKSRMSFLKDCEEYLYSIAAPQPAQELMVDMCPPATARDRWMYEQGRLAERDPRSHPAQPSEPAQPVAQPNIQNQIVKDISRHEPCHTCAHYQQGKLPGVRIHDETCYECRSYWGNKWEAA